MCSRAKACLGLVDPALLPVPARPGLRLARLIERPGKDSQAGRLAAALDAARPDLCEARAIPRDPAGRGRHRDRARSRKPAGPHAAVPAGRSGRDRRSAPSASRSARSMPRSAPRSRPPRSRRCTAPRSKTPTACARSRSRCCGPASSGASRSIRTPSRSPRAMPKSLSAEARRLRLVETVATLRRSIALEMDLAARGRRSVGDGGEYQGRSGFPRAQRSTGIAPPRTC